MQHSVIYFLIMKVKLTIYLCTYSILLQRELSKLINIKTCIYKTLFRVVHLHPGTLGL